nr:MAG TPA: hypothetical protein [Caudoviricetes sp.]
MASVLTLYSHLYISRYCVLMSTSVSDKPGHFLPNRVSRFSESENFLGG